MVVPTTLQEYCLQSKPTSSQEASHEIDFYDDDYFDTNDDDDDDDEDATAGCYLGEGEGDSGHGDS